MFAATKRFTTAVGLINATDAGRFPLMLSRVLQKLHLKARVAPPTRGAPPSLALARPCLCAL